MRCLSCFGLPAVVAGLVLWGPAGSQAAEKEAGGRPSTYASYPGTATIVGVEKAPPEDRPYGQPRAGYHVWFTFQPSGKPSGEVKEAMARLAGPRGYEFR